MKSLEHNIIYQILTIRIKLIENNDRWHKYVKENGFGEELNEIDKIRKDLDNRLKTIEKEYKTKYESLELNSENINELQKISNILLEFKDFDANFILDIENKIKELIDIKEQALKKHDFKTANYTREEIYKLQKHLNT